MLTEPAFPTYLDQTGDVQLHQRCTVSSMGAENEDTENHRSKSFHTEGSASLHMKF
jgi:hypothetical protein